MAQFAVLNLSLKSKKVNKTFFTRNLRKLDENKLLLDIASIKWNKQHPPETSMANFVNTINNIDKHAPLQKVKKKNICRKPYG